MSYDARAGGIMSVVVMGVVVLLAWSNGSNDNFKGVSTLYGSGSAGYKTALTWATAMQLAGSLLTMMLAAGLVKTFSAKGLVPDAVAMSQAFLSAAALGAGLTVFLATLVGLPVSTTHALTGALIGAGLATGAGVNFAVLGKSFVLPLLLSPVLAVVLTAGLYPIARKRFGIERQSCVSIGTEYVPIHAVTPNGLANITEERLRLAVVAGTSQDCVERYNGNVVGLSAQRAVDTLHFVSAGAVCFARA
jgi:PiT family inorganic phosphate transporter